MDVDGSLVFLRCAQYLFYNHVLATVAVHHGKKECPLLLVITFANGYRYIFL